MQEGARCIPDGGFIWLWDLAQARPLGVLPRYDDGVGGLTFSRDSALLAGSDGQSLRLWSLEPLQEAMTILPQFGPMGSAVFSPDGLVLAYRDGETIQFKTLPPDLAIYPDPSVRPSLGEVEDFAAYTEEQLRAVYTMNDASGLNQGNIHLARRDGLAVMALDYTINQPPPADYLLVERCFTPEQDWRNARHLEVWVENDDQPKTLVVQFGEGCRCAGEAFPGEVWRAFIPLLPGDKRAVDVRLAPLGGLAGFPLGRADWSPVQNEQPDLDRIGYLAIGVHGGSPHSGAIYLGPMRLWP
jgi:hypothetical protein